MKLMRPGPWIGFMSLGVVLYLALGDLKRNSPGPLSSVHAIAVENSCAACHGGWFQEMTDACLECHEPIAEQLESSEGLHGTFGRERARACAVCHSDHHGAGFAMVNEHTFAMAGVADKSKFDHETVGFSMTERHLEVDCVACHEHADAIALAEGQRRYLGLDQKCASCHEDTHEGQYVLSCDSCHSQQDFETLEAKGHDDVLPLIGAHLDVACADCHEKDELHSLESLGQGRKPQLRGCIDCHDSPHDPEFLAAVADVQQTTVDSGCRDCHLHEHESFREPDFVLTTEQHALTGFALESHHEEAECGDCHSPGHKQFRLRYPGRSQDDCASCHDDPHGGQFSKGRFAEAGCVDCHDRHQFEPHAFTAEMHSGGAMSLTGSHLDQECSACHVDPVDDSPRKFHGLEAGCDTCHQDAHDTFFADHEVVSGACERCHDATKFSNVPEDEFDHQQWTGVLIAGAHAEQSCETCHKPTADPDELGRKFGRIKDAFGLYKGCVTCHADPHQGAFDSPPASPAGATHPDRDLIGDGQAKDACLRCHSQVSFRSLPQGFDHGKWTGFSIGGAHDAAKCTACHKPLRQADANGRTWGRAAGRDCADCHRDPHVGQFERRGRTDCVRCHKSQLGFGELTFRHNLDSRFVLGEAHKKLECGKCHRRAKLKGGVAVLYRGMGRECADCHGEQNQLLRGRRRRRR